MSNQPQWVSATEVASFVYCPEHWRLEHGLELQATNQRQRELGQATHQRWRKTELRTAYWLRATAVVFLIILLLWALQ